MGSADRTHRNHRGGALIAAAIGLSCTGCVEQMVVDGFVSDLRRGGAAVDTVHDFDLGRTMAEGNLGTFEVLHRVAPDNEDGLYLLTRGWSLVSTVFLIDEYEHAVAAGDAALSIYEAERVRAGLLRARYYARAFLSERDDDFEQAAQNEKALTEWLRSNFDEEGDASALLWTALSWAPQLPSAFDADDQPHVGIALVRRAIELDDGVEQGLGHVVLGSYFAKTGNLAEARRHLTTAVALEDNRNLSARIALATFEHCTTRDDARYRAALRAIATAGDTLPAARLMNIAAARAAERRLMHPALFDACR